LPVKGQVERVSRWQGKVFPGGGCSLPPKAGRLQAVIMAIGRLLGLAGLGSCRLSRLLSSRSRNVLLHAKSQRKAVGLAGLQCHASASAWPCADVSTRTVSAHLPAALHSLASITAAFTQALRPKLHCTHAAGLLQLCCAVCAAMVFLRYTQPAHSFYCSCMPVCAVGNWPGLACV
jgi:hypothetical protein